MKLQYPSKSQIQQRNLLHGWLILPHETASLDGNISTYTYIYITFLEQIIDLTTFRNTCFHANESSAKTSYKMHIPLYVSSNEYTTLWVVYMIHNHRLSVCSVFTADLAWQNTFHLLTGPLHNQTRHWCEPGCCHRLGPLQTLVNDRIGMGSKTILILVEINTHK